MSRILRALLASSLLIAWSVAQEPVTDKSPGQNQSPPRSERDKEADSVESSSRSTKIDISPPADDAKQHPNSSTAVSDAEDDGDSDVQELHAWDPHKAGKDIEIGDFYFKRKNFRAALARYQDALLWKSNDALANFRIAQCWEKLDDPAQAVNHYQEYLKILPHGPLSQEAEKSLEKLKASGSEGKNVTEGSPKP